MLKLCKVFIRFLIILVFLLTGSAILAGTANAVMKGTPFLIGTSTYGNAAAFAAFDGTNYLVGMEEGVGPEPVEYLDTQTAQFISQSGTLIGSRIYIGHRGGMARVGFNGTNYLVYWPDDGAMSETSHAVYGRVINPSGTTVKDDFAISSLGAALDPGVFFCKSTEECTVTWSLRDENGTVYGRDISPTGSFLTDTYTLFSNTRTNAGSVDTGAACDSNGNCMVTIDTGSQILALIKGPTINKSSFVIATKTSAGSCTDKNPVGVAFDGTNYLVVWNDHSDCAEIPAWDVLAQRIDATGNLVGSAFQINSESTWRAAMSAIAYDGHNYLVTWIDGRNDADKDGVCDSGEGTCDDIYGQFVNKSGALLGSEFVINNDAGNQMGWVTGFNNGKYLALVNSGISRVGTGALAGGSAYGMFITKFVKNDFNNDRTSDMVWRNATTGQVTAWLMNSNGTRSGYKTIITNTDWTVVGTGDINRDNVADVVARQISTGQVSIWFMKSDGTRLSNRSVVTAPAWDVVGTGDFNTDGITDILVRAPSTGQVNIWFMNSNGTRASSKAVLTSTAWNVAGTGDVNGDGITDIVARASSTGQVNIWFMKSDGTRLSSKMVVTSTAWDVVGTGDFNGDGIIDILARASSTGQTNIWFMNTDGSRKSSKMVITALDWTPVGTGYFNADGISDIVAKSTTGKVNLWFMNSDGTRSSYRTLLDNPDWIPVP